MMFLLSTLIFLPILGSILIFILGQRQVRFQKNIALAFSLVTFLAALATYVHFDHSNPAFQYLEQRPWFTLSLASYGQLNIGYLLGLDGISLPFVLLTGLVFPIAILLSSEIKIKQSSYFALVLLLLGTVMGCFVALDFFLFFLFFEFMLLPMFFLIGIWGGARREYASLKFFIYTLIGSIFILIAMIFMAMSTVDMSASMSIGLNVHTLDFRLLEKGTNYLPDSILTDLNYRNIVFWLLVAGFLIKLPAVPVHTWLPDAHVEAPTPVSIILAAVLLKIGGYGLIRIGVGFFPDVAYYFANALSIIGLVAIIYGGYASFAQRDLKKLVAYSSISHMGFVVLGISALNAQGLSGAVFQMFSHGILSAMLFALVGVLYSRTHDRQIDNYRGLAKHMPWFAFFTAVGFLASLGLPGFSGFIGEFFSIWGGLASPVISKWVASAAVIGILLSATYFLYTYQRMFFGEFWANRDFAAKLPDLNRTEKLVLAVLATLSLLYGVYPALLLNISNVSITLFLEKFNIQ